MIAPTKETVLLLHQLVAQESGGDPGVRDEALLESALASAFQTFDGADLYPTKEAKAARLGYALVSNHAFVDGNKRIGMLVMLSFLEANGIPLRATDADIAAAGLALASGAGRIPHRRAALAPHWQPATLGLETLPHWQHSPHPATPRPSRTLPRVATLPFTLYPFNPFNPFNLFNPFNPMKRLAILLPLLALAAGAVWLVARGGGAGDPVERLVAEMVQIPGRDYRMGKYEVTQAQWEAVMGENPSYFKGADHAARARRTTTAASRTGRRSRKRRSAAWRGSTRTSRRVPAGSRASLTLPSGSSTACARSTGAKPSRTSRWGGRSQTRGDFTICTATCGSGLKRRLAGAASVAAAAGTSRPGTAGPPPGSGSRPPTGSTASASASAPPAGPTRLRPARRAKRGTEERAARSAAATPDHAKRAPTRNPRARRSPPREPSCPRAAKPRHPAAAGVAAPRHAVQRRPALRAARVRKCR